jgi:hypothetical protein
MFGHMSVRCAPRSFWAIVIAAAFLFSIRSAVLAAEPVVPVVKTSDQVTTACPDPAPMEATLNVWQPRVEVSLLGSEEWIPAESGHVIGESYRARTARNGSAEMVYSQSSTTGHAAGRVNISPNQQLHILQLRAGVVHIPVLDQSGRIVSEVRQESNIRTRLRIETPTGTIEVAC